MRGKKKECRKRRERRESIVIRISLASQISNLIFAAARDVGRVKINKRREEKNILRFSLSLLSLSLSLSSVFFSLEDSGQKNHSRDSIVVGPFKMRK